MANFFTSDTHFGHENIIRYCSRPFSSVSEMNNEMIRRWNSVVKNSDTVYHLGDFALGPKVLWRSYREQLNGRIVFTTGNHDAPDVKFRDMMLFGDIAVPEMSLETDRGIIHCAHIPVSGDEMRGYSRPRAIADVYLCGHVHNAWVEEWLPEREPYRCVNVGVDVRDFTPRTLDEILFRSVH